MKRSLLRVPSPSPLDILFNTPDLVAVMKPAGLASIPGRGETDSVLERLGRQLDLPTRGESDPRIRVVHRLDKDTSGVLLFAKRTAVQRHLSHQFQNNTVEKQYLALVVGKPSAAEGEIDAALAPHPNSPRHMAVVKHRGRPARTHWTLEERFRDFSLLRVFPRTGKTHQIRVHLRHIDLPLAIDPLYNPPRHGTPAGIRLSQFKRDYRPGKHEQERPLIARLPLHAEVLSFDDPDNVRTVITAPLPRDFRAVLNMLRKYGR